MNYSYQRVGGSGVCSRGKFRKFGPLRMHFLHSGARIGAFEQETQIAAEIIQNSGKILLFFPNKSCPIQCSCFVASVSHVSCKI